MQAMTTRMGFRLALREGNPRGLPRPFVDRMYRDYDRRTRAAVLKTYRAMVDATGIATRQARMLRTLRRPALVVWGQRDPYLPARLAERQREGFPEIDIVMLDGSGHWPFMDAPERVAEAVVPFLRRVLSDGR
jgi:pimeloyl-ACP methyl ester carboxylesterase